MVRNKSFNIILNTNTIKSEKYAVQYTNFLCIQIFGWFGLWKIYILPAVWVRSSDFPWKLITLEETDVEGKVCMLIFFSFIFSECWCFFKYSKLGCKKEKIFYIFLCPTLQQIQNYWCYYLVQTNWKLNESFIFGRQHKACYRALHNLEKKPNIQFSVGSSP